MKRFFLLLGFFLFLYGPTFSSEAVVDRVVAVVNQEIITLSEVEKLVHPLKEEIVAEDRLEKREQMQALRRQVLEKLIEEKLIEQEVKKSGVKVTNKEIEAVIEEIKRRNAATQEQLEKALAAEGMTFETYKKQIEKNLQRQRVINWSVKVKKKAEEKDLREFYEKNKDRYRIQETYRPSHILFIIPKGASPEEIRRIRKRCEDVLDRIKGGEDFGEMAVLYSEDSSNKDRGDLGYFKRGELLPALEKEVLSLKVGEGSKIVRTQFGFHIIRLLDRKGTNPLPFDEVRERVVVDYYDSERQKAFRQYISTLKENAIIEIKL